MVRRKTSARKVAKKRWFQMVVAKRRTRRPPHTGWRKDLKASTRRRRVLRAQYDKYKPGSPKAYLAAARAMTALANVTKDPETCRKARADAVYFYRRYRKLKGGG